VTPLTQLFSPQPSTAQQPTPMLIEGDTQLSREQVWQQAQQLAAFLQAQGVQPGERVAVLQGNNALFLKALLACRLLGAVFVPLNYFMLGEDVLYVVQHSQPKLLLADAQLAKGFVEGGQVPPCPVFFSNLSEATPWAQASELSQALQAYEGKQVEPAAEDSDALALLLYTSGTTGRPKGVMLSESNLLSNLAGFKASLGFDGQETMLMGLPLFHAYGLICALYALERGWPLVLLPQFQPKAILQLIAQHQVTLLPLVPTMLQVLAQQADRLDSALFASLRYCISGGAALSPRVLEVVERVFGCPVLEGYGLSETAPVVAVNTPVVGRLPGSVGTVLPNVHVRIAEERQLEGQASTQPVGEVQIKGPNVMLGYYRDEAGTKAAFSEDGWFKSGDLGILNNYNQLFISGGRLKDIIIKNGENIAALRVEQLLQQHPQVKEAAVLGVPSTRSGESLLAVVEGEEGLEEAQLKQWVRQQLPPLLQPDAYHLVEQLPRTPTGKVVKKVLAQQLAQKQETVRA
jgi:long-chain acyl-CoA synthetase